jgi:hypothetical protein
VAGYVGSKKREEEMIGTAHFVTMFDWHFGTIVSTAASDN